MTNGTRLTPFSDKSANLLAGGKVFDGNGFTVEDGEGSAVSVGAVVFVTGKVAALSVRVGADKVSSEPFGVPV